MSDDQHPTTYQTNRLRRGCGALAGLSPVMLLIASLVRSMTTGGRASTAAVVVMLVACSVATLNLYLSFIRGRIKRHREKRHVSGLPMIATALVLVGAVVGFGSAVVASIGLLTMALDTGGSVWFLVATWRDASLWDAPHDAARRR